MIIKKGKKKIKKITLIDLIFMNKVIMSCNENLWCAHKNTHLPSCQSSLHSRETEDHWMRVNGKVKGEMNAYKLTD